MVYCVMSTNSSNAPRRWNWAIPFAFASTALILGLFYTWFVAADRYTVFLYNDYAEVKDIIQASLSTLSFAP